MVPYARKVLHEFITVSQKHISFKHESAASVSLLLLKLKSQLVHLFKVSYINAL